MMKKIIVSMCIICVPAACALAHEYGKRPGIGGPLYSGGGGRFLRNTSEIVLSAQVVPSAGTAQKAAESPDNRGNSEAAMKEEDPLAASLTNAQKKRLIDIARSAITTYLTTGEAPPITETDPRLSAGEGAFVTLRKDGRLRGCIGHIVGRAPLYKTVQEVAVSAATQDARFNPVAKNELDDIDIEVSVLSQPRRIAHIDEIHVGIHGVIVSKGLFNRGVFLPDVATETGWTRNEFLSQLCSQKAGLPADCWKDPQVRFEIFSTEKFSEKDFSR